jgi:hypothetical protein
VALRAKERDMKKPSTVVLIHGLFMTALSWERWVDRYSSKGYEVIAKSWPGMDDIDQLRDDPSGVEHLGIGEIVDYYDVEPLMAVVQGPLETARLTLIRGLGEPRVLSAERLGVLVAIARRAREAGDANLCWNVLWRAAQRCFWADPGLEARNLVVRAAEEADPDGHEPRLAAVLAYAAPLEKANTVIDLISRWPTDRGDAEAARLLGSAAVVVGAFDLSAPFLLGRLAAYVRKAGSLTLRALSLCRVGARHV